MISKAYRKLLERFHFENKGFGGGRKHYTDINNLIIKYSPKEILDYGCGKGSLAEMFPTQNWKQYELGIKSKDIPPSPAEAVVCLDVLEHVELNYINLVLKHLRELTKRILFCTITFLPSNKILPAGRNAHILIKSKDWWQIKFNFHFRGGVFLKHQKEYKTLKFLWEKN